MIRFHMSRQPLFSSLALKPQEVEALALTGKGERSPLNEWSYAGGAGLDQDANRHLARLVGQLQDLGRRAAPAV